MTAGSLSQVRLASYPIITAPEAPAAWNPEQGGLRRKQEVHARKLNPVCLISSVVFRLKQQNYFFFYLEKLWFEFNTVKMKRQEAARVEKSDGQQTTTRCRSRARVCLHRKQMGAERSRAPFGSSPGVNQSTGAGPGPRGRHRVGDVLR